MLASGRTRHLADVRLPRKYNACIRGRDIGEPTGWLSRPENCWRAPVEVAPGSLHGMLTAERLDEVAHVAAQPEEWPTDVEDVLPACDCPASPSLALLG